MNEDTLNALIEFARHVQAFAGAVKKVNPELAPSAEALIRASVCVQDTLNCQPITK